MRKAVIIVLSVCLVFAVFVSTFYLAGNNIPSSEAQATAAEDAKTDAPGKIVVWNKDRDLKAFETEDNDVMSAVVTLIRAAGWTAAGNPPAGDYLLSIYDENGQATEYTIQQTDAGITLFRQKPDADGSYEKADFPAKSGGLGSYLNID